MSTTAQLITTGVVLLLCAAFCLAKTWMHPAGVFATIGAVLIVVVVIATGIPAAIGAGGYVITTIAEMMGG